MRWPRPSAEDGATRLCTFKVYVHRQKVTEQTTKTLAEQSGLDKLMSF